MFGRGPCCFPAVSLRKSLPASSVFLLTGQTKYTCPVSSARSPVKAFDHDTNGHVLLPKWFLGFLSAIAALLSIGVVPWATGISNSLGELSENLARLSVRLDGQVETNNAAFGGLQHRIERLELKLDRLEEWRRAASPLPPGFSGERSP